MPNQAHRQKNFAGHFRQPPQPNGAMQNHAMLRPGYHSVQFLDTKCTVGILRTYCHSICAAKSWVNTEFYALRKRTITAMCIMNGYYQFIKCTYVSLIHMAILTTIYWIKFLRPSPVFWHLWPCFHALHGQMPAINKLPSKCVKL